MTPPNPAIGKAQTEQLVLPDPSLGAVDEAVWVDVIRQMDEIYIDLVQHHTALEEKNLSLEATCQQLRQAHEELQQAQNQLIKAEKMASLGRLVAGVAHELNNPVSFILGNAHTLKRYHQRLQAFFTGLDKLADPNIEALRAENQIDRMLLNLVSLVDGTTEGAVRVSDIVDTLLRFTKPQQQQAAEFDISQLLNKAAYWLARAASVKPQVIFNMPESAVICSFEGPIHLIVMNLLENAVDAVEKVAQPTVWASLQISNSQLICRIRDNGSGLDRDHIHKVFDPFFTTKRVGKGTGLGLYISYLLATDHCGGTLEAKNHHLGGAEFCLMLPIRSQCVPRQGMQSQATQNQAIQKQVFQDQVNQNAGDADENTTAS